MNIKVADDRIMLAQAAIFRAQSVLKLVAAAARNQQANPGDVYHAMELAGEELAKALDAIEDLDRLNRKPLRAA